MIHSFNFWVANRVRIWVPESGFRRDEANLMVYTTSGLIVAVGDESEGARSHAEFRIVPMYDAARFDPEGTFTAIQYFAMLARSEYRPGLLQLFGIFDRTDMVFRLPAYEEAPVDQRLKFERLLRDMPFARSYSINGHESKVPRIRLR